MGMAESILSNAEGLNPSYAGIAALQAAGKSPAAIKYRSARKALSKRRCG